RLSTNFNIAFNRNMVIEMRSENDQIWGPNAFMRWNMIRPGLPINVFWGHKILGIFQNQEEIDKNPNGGVANIPGTYQYWDANGDGQIVLDGTDMTQIGNPHPDF